MREANLAEILVADDDSSLRVVLNQALSRAGHDVRVTSNAGTLWRWVEGGAGDAVISDVVMPDQTVFDILPRIRNARPDLPVIVMSAQNTFMTAIRASETGAYDYLPKPFDLGELLATLERALTGSRPAPTLDMEHESIPLVGRSPAMQDVFRIVARVMQTELTVLIVGESGTGKELVARALHDYGPRRRGAFVAVNMAAIPQELVESELFGHEKGAFTGALARSTGRFEQADGGTLFLDEIGDMPMAAQTRLLRVLQEGEYTSVGGRTPRATDVRIVTATNRSLPELIERGRFREDLFYRLNVVPLRLPPLRERASDVPDLVRHFFHVGAADGLPVKTVDPSAMRLLQDHAWPGNVRELENLVRRLAALYPQPTIGVAQVRSELTDAQTLPNSDGPGANVDLQDAVSRWLEKVFADADPLPAPGLYHRTLEEVERPLLTAALAATHGNQIRAAEILGLNRNTLRKKIRDLELTVMRDPR